MYKTLLLEKKDRVLHVTLNRPDVRNAFNDILIDELTQVFQKETNKKDIRVVVLKGAGKVFSAGGDLNWMKESASYTREQNREDAKKLAFLLKTMNELGLPLVGQVHGAALGGGMGLVAVCDHVIAAKDATFGFSETRLGLIPAVIGPFVIAKIGQTQARSLFLTAELFEANKALEIGLAHQVVEPDQLETATQKMIQNLLLLSPQALKTAKHFIQSIQDKTFDEQLEIAVQTLADLRVTKEAQEGIQAFLEKRKPNW